MELIFDKMDVDTTLAQAYLKTIEQDSDNNYMKDSLFYDGIKYNSEITECSNYKPINYGCQQLKTLCARIKENINLMANLEYFTRGIPIEDSKKQIDVIIQHINYVFSIHLSEEELKSDINLPSHMYMSKDAPLLMLGYVAKAVIEEAKYLMIHADESISALCVLFTELCYEVGLPVGTIFEKCFSNARLTKGLPSLVGTLGVICEHSDTDSAVEMLLESSVNAPWKLQRILVQESVSEQFRNALKWKCNLNETSKSNSLIYRGRQYVLDQLGPTEGLQNSVYVDTYRTTKELLSLVLQYPSYYLSLWANNIAEINEITYSVRTPVVWVNNFADFRGPPIVTEVLYPPLLIANVTKYAKNQKMTKLFELRSFWLKLTYEARRDIVCSILEECDSIDSKKIANSIMHGSNNSFVYNNKNFVCTLVPDVTDNVLYYVKSSFGELLTSPTFFETIILGAAYAIDTVLNNVEEEKIIDKFTNAKVPIVSLQVNEHVSDENGLPLYWNDNKRNYCSRSSRLIITNSGITFAN